MAKISTYAIDALPTINDKVIGTDFNDLNITKNYKISDILGLASQGVLGLTATRMYYGNADNLAVETTALTYIVGGEGSVAADTIKMSGGTLNASVSHINDLNSLALGTNALPPTTLPIACTAIGIGALQDIDNVSQSVAIGTETLQSLTNGVDNVAIGYRADNGTLTGERNVTVGAEARRDATDGTDNVMVGYRTGLQMGASAIHNVGIGCATMQGALLGQFNVAIGSFALFQQTGGDFNVAVGNAALNNLLVGTNNTAIGKGAGAQYGFFPNSPIEFMSNTTCLGHNARPNGDNEVVLGDTSIAVLRCNQTNITSLSDARDKTDIEDMPLGLNFLMDVKPRVWNWDRRDGTMQGMRDSGFVSQELDAALTAHNGHLDIPSLVDKRNDESWGVASGALIPVLVKAIQELKAEIELLKNG